MKPERDYSCADCRAERYRMFMVHDHVWNGEAKLPTFGVVLCLPCLEKRIGRTLGASDFTCAPLNWWPRWGVPLRPEPTDEEIRTECAYMEGNFAERMVEYARLLRAGLVAP